MNKMIEKNDRYKDNQLLLATFDIQDKCIELEAIIADKRYNLFKGASVVVAVPTLDESSQYIRKNDFELFNKQCKDAFDMALYLTQNNANFINIIKDINTEMDNYLDQLGGRALDYLICLHEFMETEKNFIVESLSNKIGCDFEVIELY